MIRTRHPANVPGPFYVEDGCCVACGVWELDAAGLLAWLEDGGKDHIPHCYVARQPETDAEFRQILRAMQTNEVDCLRVRDCKPEWARELRYHGLGRQIDAKKSVGRTALSIALLALSAGLMLASVVLALLWLQRLSFTYNEQGRYFDAANGVVYDQSAVMVYGILTLLFALGAGLAFRGASR
jgi:hypothetical protein